MTPKEKAIELVEKFRISKAIDESYAKQCALIALDLLLYYSESPEAFIEFEEIKNEIEKL
jgi:hypothetical protein